MTGQVPKEILIKAHMMPFQKFNTNFHLTNSMEQIRMFVDELIVAYMANKVHSNPPLGPVLSHMNPIHALTSYSLR
jgi:hypothetical protein